MGGILLKKCLGIICFEDEKDSCLNPEKEAVSFDLLLSSIRKSTLSRVLTGTSARDVWIILRKLHVGKLHLHTKTKFVSSDTRIRLQLKTISTLLD